MAVIATVAQLDVVRESYQKLRQPGETLAEYTRWWFGTRNSRIRTREQLLAYEELSSVPAESRTWERQARLTYVEHELTVLAIKAMTVEQRYAPRG